ncbi:MAG: methyltransferase domain-containing protein [Alphaproteobacteria bacterium]|nr:methyltransferase domain-containing protein [Alphaproteobacteria bacterium]
MRGNVSARGAALDLLEAVLVERRFLDDALDNMPTLPERDRAFARLIVATVLRRLGELDAALEPCLAKPLPARAHRTQNVLRIGAVQLLMLGTPAHAAVGETVDAAHRRLPKPHVGLVNAVLRRVAREGKALLPADAAALNTPKWLWRGWSERYGEETCRAIAAAHQREAGLDLSVKDGAAALATRLGGRVLPTGSIRLENAGAVPRLDGFEAGVWWVQDAAAALPVKLLGDVRGKHVIDLCAAPGGKTAQLATAGARVTAIDRSPERLARLTTNLKRLGLEAETIAADAASWRPSQPADAVLLDAPCSATGTIRRHPDIPHLKSPRDVTDAATTQRELLDAALTMVKPGGMLVYAVCSLQPEEGEAQIEALLAKGAPLRRRPITASEVGGLKELVSPAGDLRTLPSHIPELGGLDGFYAGRLERQ